MNLDEEIRNALRSSVRPADVSAGYQAVQARLHPAPRRRRNGLRVAVYACVATVLVAAIAVGSLEAVEHLGGDQPIIVITDDTVGISPGSTGQGGQTTGTTASKTAVATSRGDLERTGVYPSGGPSEPPELLGKYPGAGDPVVSDGLVFLSPQYGGDLYALDIRTGKEKLRFPGVGAPTVSDGVAYAGGGGYLYALDIQTGEEKWRFHTGGEVRSSPAVLNGVVYFACDSGGYVDDGYVYAVDTENGQERWRFRAGDFAYGSPAISEGVIYFSYSQPAIADPDLDDHDVDHWDYRFYAVDIATGQQKWRVEGAGQVITSPAVSGGMVYFGGDDGYLHALDVTTGQDRWKFSTGPRPSSSSPAVFQGVVYFGGTDGYLYALDAATGQERWRFLGLSPDYAYGATGEPEPGGAYSAPYYSSPIVSGAELYVGAEYTWGYRSAIDSKPGPGLCALDIATGEELWRFDVEAGAISSPAISDGVVYFTADGWIYALK